MSKVEASRFYLIPTVLGNMGVKVDLLSDFDVEDLVRNRATSQARALQMLNVGKLVDMNAVLPEKSVPSAFRDNDEILPEG